MGDSGFQRSWTVYIHAVSCMLACIRGSMHLHGMHLQVWGRSVTTTCVHARIVHSRLLHGPYFNLTDFRLWLTTLPSEAHRHKPVQLLAVCIQCRFNLLHLMDVFGDLRYGQPACKTERPLGGAALYTLSRVLQLNVRCCLFCRSSGKGYLAWTLVGRIAILSTLVSFRIPPLFKLAAPDN